MRIFIGLVLAVLAGLLLPGCGGGGVSSSPSDPPPPATWTVKGTATFYPTMTHPAVMLATQDSEGILHPVAYAAAMTMPSDAAGPVAIPFSLTFEKAVVGTFHLVSFNGSGIFQQSKLVGDWAYQLINNGTSVSVADAFGSHTDWGTDATVCSDQITIDAQYTE